MDYNPATEVIMQLAPLMIIQIFYAWFAFVLCRKQKWPWIWGIVTLVPLIGLIVFACVFITTQFNTLDRLNRLEGKA